MFIDARRGHALWSTTYDLTPNPLLHLDQRVVGPWLANLDGKLVADIACGTGRWARLAAARGASVVALDFCAPMLRQACGRCIQADALCLPIRDAVVDVAVCSFAAGYIASVPRLLAEMARVTKRGGHVIASDVHPDAGWRRSFRAGDRVYDIIHQAHALSEYRADGLERLASREESLAEPERHLFIRAGSESRFAEACVPRAVFAFLWRRA